MTPTAQTPQVTQPPSSNQIQRRSFLVPILLVLNLVLIVVIILLSYNRFFTQSTTQPETMPTPTPQSLLPTDKLRIGNDTTFKPMEYVNDQGEVVGYDIDLGNFIARELGTNADIQTIAWEDVFTALENGDIDVIISSVSITDERKLKYEFSDAYLNAGQVVITQKTNTTITSPDDLTNKRVGVQINTTSEDEAKKFTSLVTTFPDPTAAIAKLVTGELDAVISDLPAAKGFTSDNPTLKIASDPFTSEFYGIVAKKGNRILINRINQILASITQKGILTDLKQKWLE